MSLSTPGQTSTPSSSLKSIFDAALSRALSEYKKNTGKELLDYPFATEVQRCDTVDAILAIRRGQAREFQQFRDGDQRLMKWINPVVDVLYTFSGTIGEIAGVAFRPAETIFTGIGVLLAAAKDVRASHDTLVGLFERIESFFKRLGVYTQVSLTTEMAEVFVKIVAEVLSILSIATKEVKRKRAKIYFRKLLGRTDIEDALKRLDSLIQEEVQMAIAQTMKITTEHKDDAKKANVAITNNIDEIKWNQIDQDIRKWFSPPDPSTNHNTACHVYHNAQPMWFFEADVFKGWISNGSLLWVHGKPGSGKSVLCSAIIQQIVTLRDAGRATLAYFYFDFRDEEKQSIRNFVTSLLVQLSACSKPCCDIIYNLYLACGKGARQPSDGILVECLKEMLKVATPHPIFIIMDALDECSDSGLPTPREEVLVLVKELVRPSHGSHLPHLHMCITSRLEFDIQTQLKPLAVNAISLHDETRKNKAIANYVSSVVSSDEHMRKWRDEDRERVVEVLSERADGMFQWVFCQFETLRHAVQPDLRWRLEALPRTLRLDETYERILKNIDRKSRKHAWRLLHCLAVAIRPLRVEELAEIFAFDFDGAQGGIPEFHADWQPNDQEGAIMTTCSSLITIIDDRGNRVVQFSHLSIKEFLTSNHLASSTGDLSLYHILPRHAHTILAQVCLGILLHLDDHNYDKSLRVSPLAEYAARHWVTHAQFEDVASESRVMDGMKSLFDPDKPHFAAWIGLFDIDAESDGILPSETPSPLYFSALCGFYDLVQYLAIERPQHVNAIGGSYGFPLFAALCRNHFEVAEILLKNGGNVDVRDKREQTALHKTIDRHNNVAIDAVRFLLEHGANVNAQRDDLWTPLHLAVNTGELAVARVLLDHQADVNLRNGDGQAPLHLLSKRETSQDEDNSCDIAKLLLERGANVNEKDKNNVTPVHLASYYKKLEILRILLDHHAKTNSEADIGETALHGVSRVKYEFQEDGVRVAKLLLDHGVDVNAQSKDHWTPLHLASLNGRLELAQVLLDRGAKANAEANGGDTPLHVVACGKHESQENTVHIAQLLLERGADVNAEREDHWTPLHLASHNGKLELAHLLLDRGAKANTEANGGNTPLHFVAFGKYQSQEDGVRITQLLLEHGADVNAQRGDHWTPLHLASHNGKLKLARVLLDHGAKANAEANARDRPLHVVGWGTYESHEDGVCIAKLLLEHGADVNAQRRDHWTPLHLASHNGKLELARVLLEHGANANAEANARDRPLHVVGWGKYKSQEDGVCIAKLLLEHGADVNAQRRDHWTPLHLASHNGKLELARVLLGRGAKANAEANARDRPLHVVGWGTYKSQEDGVCIAKLLLEHGADVNAQRGDHWTPLHLASHNGKLELARVLLEHGANANAEANARDRPLHVVGWGTYESQEDGVCIAKLLLEHGADVNARRRDHWTPLHLASHNGKLELARVLLDCGANADAEADARDRPLHVVGWGTYESQEDGACIAKLLLEHGADVNARRRDLSTPLQLASHNGKLELSRVLLNHGA